MGTWPADEGHPPLAYVWGMGVAPASFLLAPIGTGAALAGLLRARREGTGTSFRSVALLGLNLLLLLRAVGFYVWMWWASSRLY